jgi:hypothetical protein
VIGCAIAIGRRAKPAPVFDAAALIERKFKASTNPKVTPKLMRHLRAWLHVERAVALRNGGRRGGMIMELLRSMCLVPRIRVQLRDWWDGQPSDL